MKQNMSIIAFYDPSNGETVSYYRGETGHCQDRRDAKIYQHREDAEKAAAQLRGSYPALGISVIDR